MSSLKKKKPTFADVADKYQLYQASVQEPEHEVDFFTATYKKLFKRTPKTLREDFCGTFAVSCEWAKKRGRVAYAVDLDPEPLDWGREHNLSQLSKKQQQNVHVLQEDVRSEAQEPVDVLAAQNFSFWYFKTRQEVIEYFQYAYANLADEGMMVMDMMGGPECLEEDHEDLRSYSSKGITGVKGGFKYIWEQARYCPITHDCDFYISFRFKDGSALERCFHYHWRFWSIPEVCEMLEEAGFAKPTVYWEQEDEEGEGNGEYEPQEKAKSDPSWIAYIIATK